MKKIAVFLMVALMICLSAVLVSCGKSEEVTDGLTYKMDLSISENVLKGEQVTTFTNVYADVLSEAVFHLYPNAYREDAVHPAYELPMGTYGQIDVKSVSVGESAGDYAISEDGEYLTVKLPEVERKGSVSVSFSYETTLPSGGVRLSKKGSDYLLSGFYPQLSVYEKDGFRKDPFCAVGDPIYSGTATYDVTLTCDTSLVVCSSAGAGEKTEESGKQTLHYTCPDVRDFCIAASPNYQVKEKMAGDVRVYYFYRNDERAQETLDLAASAVETFSSAFGAYPYGTYTVARAFFDCDGMEYSGMSVISESCSDIEETVLHETAHQWWYGVVGSDPIYECYMDEGLTTFTSAYYYALKGDEARFDAECERMNRAYASYEKLQKMRKTEAILAMDKPLYEYTAYQYTMVEYVKGALMFRSLYDLYGKEKFLACLQKYVENNRFSFGGKDRFIEAAKGTMGDVSSLMESWIGDKIVATTFAQEE